MSYTSLSSAQTRADLLHDTQTLFDLVHSFRESIALGQTLSALGALEAMAPLRIDLSLTLKRLATTETQKES